MLSLQSIQQTVNNRVNMKYIICCLVVIIANFQIDLIEAQAKCWPASYAELIRIKVFQNDTIAVKLRTIKNANDEGQEVIDSVQILKEIDDFNVTVTFERGIYFKQKYSKLDGKKNVSLCHDNQCAGPDGTVITLVRQALGLPGQGCPIRPQRLPNPCQKFVAFRTWYPENPLNKVVRLEATVFAGKKKLMFMVLRTIVEVQAQ